MSKIEVNQISSQCGSTLTIGQSGDTVTLACGATQSGFGRTGTVDWDTTAKTASFTAVSGNGYFVNTTSGAITVTLPAGSAGDIVGISDYASTFQTNNVTITPNGTDKINGENSSATLNTQGIAVSLVYVDATRGWKSVTGSDNDTTGVPPFICATGGTITTCGNCRIHTFTSPGTFCVSRISPSPVNNVVSYLVVAGGAGSGGMTSNCNGGGGGGGAGGFREYKSPVTPYTASPLDGNPGGTAVTVTATAFPITVGAGGAGKTSNLCVGGSGSNSIFSTITSAGGGGGGTGNCGGPQRNGVAGGSGGGGGSGPATAGTGNTPPVSPSQGNPGGTSNGTPFAAGGGGGATQAGTNAPPADNRCSGPGGDGATTSISASPTAYAGGGGGGGRNPSPAGGVIFGTGGAGGGGRGQGPDNGGSGGTANTGGGAGGGVPSATPGIPNAGSGYNGGSGIVIIRYKYQ